jgi:hypothetical protein
VIAFVIGRKKIVSRGTSRTSQKWAVWFKELSAKGYLKELGHPLETAGMVVKGNQRTVTDRLYAEAKDVVGGFSLIEAKDLARPSRSPRAVRSWRSEAPWKCARSSR